MICNHLGRGKIINKKESNIGLQENRKFALQTQHTNIINLTARRRRDLQASSCINKETEVKRSYKSDEVIAACKCNIKTIKLSESTRHGMHQNTSARERTANLIGKRITNLLTRQKSLPLSLLWKEDQEDRNQKGDVTTLLGVNPLKQKIHKDMMRLLQRF